MRYSISFVPIVICSLLGCGSSEGTSQLSVVSADVKVAGAPLTGDGAPQVFFGGGPVEFDAAFEFEEAVELADDSGSASFEVEYVNAEGTQIHSESVSARVMTTDGRKIHATGERLAGPGQNPQYPQSGYECVLRIALPLEGGDAVLFEQPIYAAYELGAGLSVASADVQLGDAPVTDVLELDAAGEDIRLAMAFELNEPLQVPTDPLDPSGTTPRNLAAFYEMNGMRISSSRFPFELGENSDTLQATLLISPSQLYEQAGSPTEGEVEISLTIRLAMTGHATTVLYEQPIRLNVAAD